MRPIVKALLLVWLAWHTYVVSVNVAVNVTGPWRNGRADDAVVGMLVGVPITAGHLERIAALRQTTDFYEKALGVHQNWPMFAPNPRLSTTWLHLIGEYRDGTERVIPFAIGRPDDRSPVWVYDRGGKFERNATAKKRTYLRRGVMRDLCRDAAARGEDLHHVRFESHAMGTPPPGVAALPRSERPVSRVQLSRFVCKKKYLEPL